MSFLSYFDVVFYCHSDLPSYSFLPFCRSVRLYDIRQTSTVLDEFSSGDCPVVAIRHVPRYQVGGPGLVLGTLKGTAYRPLIEESETQQAVVSPLTSLDGRCRRKKMAESSFHLFVTFLTVQIRLLSLVNHLDSLLLCHQPGSVMWLAGHAASGQMLASFRPSAKSSVVTRHLHFSLKSGAGSAAAAAAPAREGLEEQQQSSAMAFAGSAASAIPEGEAAASLRTANTSPVNCVVHRQLTGE